MLLSPFINDYLSTSILIYNLSSSSSIWYDNFSPNFTSKPFYRVKNLTINDAFSSPKTPTVISVGFVSLFFIKAGVRWVTAYWWQADVGILHL